MELKNNLREIRRQRGLTQEELAEQVGVTRQTIISTEKGYYVPSIKFALVLSRVLDWHINELFWLTEINGE
jgi:putative transcriptional regulator